MATASASVLPAASFTLMPAVQALRPWNRQGQKSRHQPPAGTLALLPRGAAVKRDRPAMHTVQVNVSPQPIRPVTPHRASLGPGRR